MFGFLEKKKMIYPQKIVHKISILNSIARERMSTFANPLLLHWLLPFNKKTAPGHCSVTDGQSVFATIFVYSLMAQI
jgi:hypothetical protein